jgi:predicted DNA-binding transcriptional regulator AlpA
MSTTQHQPEGQRPQLEAQAWKRAGISRSHAYELMSAHPPAFPRPVKIGKASRFVSAEVDRWIASRIAERDATSSTDDAPGGGGSA